MPKRRSHKRPPPSGINKNRLKAAARQADALDLRKAGATYQAIASELGYSHPPAARKAVMAGLKLTMQEPADELRKLELSRCDRMQQAVWKAVLRGDVKAINAVLRIMDRRATYLGLDAPVKIDLEQRIREGAEAEGLDADEAVAIANEVIRENRW